MATLRQALLNLLPIRIFVGAHHEGLLGKVVNLIPIEIIFSQRCKLFYVLTALFEEGFADLLEVLVLLGQFFSNFVPDRLLEIDEAD